MPQALCKPEAWLPTAADMTAACANGLALVLFQLRHVSMFDWVTKVWQTTPEEEAPGALFMLLYLLEA